MVMPSGDRLLVTLPDSLGATVDVLPLEILKDKNGKRSITRQLRDANASDAGRIRRVEYELWGPIGASQESTSGRLAIDLLQNLEGRWPRQLTSSIAQTSVTLTGFDPPGTDGAYFGEAYFGDDYFGSGGISGDAQFFAEQNGYLLVGRGSLLTQVDMISNPWVVISTTVLNAPILDMDHWFGNVYIAQGSNVPMQRVVGCSLGGVVLEDVVSTSPSGNVYASAIKRGSDRAWYINAETGSDYNYQGYTLDAFVTLASPFPVGDAELPSTGLGPFGPFTARGEVDAIYTFTNQGATVQLSKALNAIHSVLNGAQFADPGFGWNYYTSVAALRAFNLSGVDNPVGVGERMRTFTGHNGLATAIFPARGELWIVYQTTAGALYGYRGQFGGETGGTGQPLLFPWFYASSEACAGIFSSTTPNGSVETTQQLTIIRGSDTNLTHMAIAAGGMDNLSSVTYSTGGGVGYLTTLDRNPNLLKTLRLLRAKARNMTSGSSWALALGVNTNPNNPTAASYTTIGTITADGEHTLLPFAAGVPLSNIAGRTHKIRVTEVAGGSGASTSPPTLEGTIEEEYDERPEQIEEFVIEVAMEGPGYGDNQNWQYLKDLVGSRTDGPFKVQLPDDLVPAVDVDSGGGQKWAMLQSVTKRTDASSDVESVVLTFQVWPQADALATA